MKTNWAAVLVAVLGVAAGVVATLMMLVMLLASMPNGSPQQLASIRNWMIATGVIGVACAIAAIVLMSTGRPWWGAGVGAVPVVTTIASFIYLLASGK